MKKNLLLLILIMSPIICYASSPALFLDLNTAITPIASNPSGLTVLDSKVYFWADDGIHGNELWTSDGTSAGTKLFADLTPGPKSSVAPLPIRKIGNTLYFYKVDFASSVVVLFKVESGKKPEKISTFQNSYAIPQIQVVGGRLFFVLLHEESGPNLWAVDGNTPKIVKSFSEEASFQLDQLTDWNGILYFAADQSSQGKELWRSDGTEGGTYMIKDINPGANGSYPGALTPFAGRLIFIANDGIHGIELWKTDGTSLGTSMIKDLVPGSDGLWTNPYQKMPVVNNKLFFQRIGDQLYTLDAGLRMNFIREFNTNEECCLEWLSEGMNYAFFSADDPLHGTALWRSDGTPDGTTMVIDPNSTDEYDIHVIEVIGNQILFTTFDGSQEVLWLSDGTSTGSRIIAKSWDIQFATGDGRNTFISMGDDSGNELFVYDSTKRSLTRMKKIRQGNASSSPRNLTVYKKSLFFSASDKVGSELWEFNGTSVKSIFRGEVGRIARTSDFLYFVDKNGKLYRFGDDRNVQSIDTGKLRFSSPLMRGVNKRLFISNYTNIFASDEAVSAIRLIAGPHKVSQLTVLEENLYLLDAEKILWQINVNTLKARKIFTAQPDERLLGLNAANGSLYFLVYRPDKTEFWMTNGNSASNVKFAETTLEANFFAFSYPHWFFRGVDQQYGAELRMLNMMTGEINLVKDIKPGPENSDPSPYAAFNGNLIFAAPYDTWITDGTDEGTFLLSKQRSTCFSFIDSYLFFTTTTDYTGYEPYIFDGQSVKLIQDIYRGPYPNSSDACEFTRFGNFVYFAATDSFHGRELWRMSVSK